MPPFFSPFLARFHPAVRLCLCLCLALAAQLLPGWLALTLAAPLVFAAGVGRRYGGLLLRTRWLLLSLFLIFALATPGTPLYPHPFSPSREGVLLGLEHGARLLAVLLAVAWLLQTTIPTALAQGGLLLLRPLGRLGLAPERGVARLLLVLRYVESAPTWPKARAWREFLDKPLEDGDESLRVEVHGLKTADFLALGSMVLGLGILFWLQGGLA